MLPDNWSYIHPVNSEISIFIPWFLALERNLCNVNILLGYRNSCLLTCDLKKVIFQIHPNSIRIIKFLLETVLRFHQSMFLSV